MSIWHHIDDDLLVELPKCLSFVPQEDYVYFKGIVHPKRNKVQMTLFLLCNTKEVIGLTDFLNIFVSKLVL